MGTTTMDTLKRKKETGLSCSIQSYQAALGVRFEVRFKCRSNLKSPRGWGVWSNIPFFKSKHIPYIVILLSALTAFILLPPLLLLFYPTNLFRSLLTHCGFCRWNILHMIMDTFQGWYKDRTEGTYDFRSLSVFYMLLRIALVENS